MFSYTNLGFCVCFIAVFLCQPSDVVGQNAVFNLNYDSESGSLSFSSDEKIRRVYISSQQNFFLTNVPIQNSWDHHATLLDMHVIDYEPGTEFSLGEVALPGMSNADLLANLCIHINRASLREPEIGSTTINSEVLSTEPLDCKRPIDPNRPVGQILNRFAILEYDPTNGGLNVRVNEPEENGLRATLTTVLIESRRGIFTGEPAMGVSGAFDAHSPNKLFKLKPSGFDGVDFGFPVAKGLTNSEFISDLCVTGSWFGGGNIAAEYLYPGAGVVPLTCNDSSDPPVQVDVAYNPTNGSLTFSLDDLVDDPQGAGRDEWFSTLEINSSAGIFTGARPRSLSGEFDAYSSHRVVKQDRNGFKSVYLDSVIAPGLDAEFIRADLKIDGTLLSATPLGAIHVTVPEPRSSMVHLMVLMVATWYHRRIRSG